VGEKANSKKQLIISKATEVFATKGYRDVTMKDIVEACEISRGGLYLYYDSTESLFLDVLKAQDDEQEDRSKKLIDRLRVASSTELLLWFLKEQKKEILKRKNSLSVAVYEYAFSCRQEMKTGSYKTGFETAALVLKKIICRGVETGEFDCDDPVSIAENMMYAIEGMKICARTMGISEKKVDKELLFMMQQFVEVEE